MKTKPTLRNRLRRAEATLWLIGVIVAGPIIIAGGMVQLISWIMPTLDADGIPRNPADRR